VCVCVCVCVCFIQFREVDRYGKIGTITAGGRGWNSSLIPVGYHHGITNPY